MVKPPPHLRPHKYGVAPKADRTLDGIVFDSKAEMLRWKDHIFLTGAVANYSAQRQVRIRLGEDTITVVDFRVREGIRTWCEEVKGHETREFKRVRRLWKKYGPCRLAILKRVSGGWNREIITPEALNDGPTD